MTTWRQRLVETISAKGLKQREVAQLAGVSLSTVNAWTAGSSPRNPIPVKRLCDKLGISFTWLMTGEHESVSIESVFDRADGWEGFAEVRIRRLVPRRNPIG